MRSENEQREDEEEDHMSGAEGERKSMGEVQDRNVGECGGDQHGVVTGVTTGEEELQGEVQDNFTSPSEKSLSTTNSSTVTPLRLQTVTVSRKPKTLTTPLRLNKKPNTVSYGATSEQLERGLVRPLTLQRGRGPGQKKMRKVGKIQKGEEGNIQKM